MDAGKINQKICAKEANGDGQVKPGGQLPTPILIQRNSTTYQSYPPIGVRTYYTVFIFKVLISLSSASRQN